jgi:PAS domain S-box-containing protein
MTNQWKSLKKIISEFELKDDLFLSLIDEKGNIVCINSTMQRSLQLENPRLIPTSFFNLLHPEHVPVFKTAIDHSRAGNPSSLELYLKNGYYHPMKWQVNWLGSQEKGDKNYLCIGYKLADDERIKQFTQSGEKNYQVIVEGLSSGVLFQDQNGELVAANQKAAEIFNTSLERLYQLRNIREVWNSSWNVSSESGAPILFDDTPFMRALQTGRAHTDVLNIEYKNGEQHCIFFGSQPLFEGDSQTPSSVLTSIVDVTYEKKLSGEISRRDTIFHAFMDKTPNLVWVLDEDANLLFANASFYTYFGVKEGESQNRSIYELVPQLVADSLQVKHLKVLENSNPIESLEKVKWADGSTFYFHVNIFPINSSDGKKMIGGHATNLTEKYVVEKKLKEANERLLMLSRATSDAIWEWDMQTGQIFRNDALMDLVGYQSDDAKGLSWWLRRIHPEDRNRVTDKIKDATDNGHQSWDDEYRFKCADGTYKHIQDRGYIVYENGLPVKMIGSLQDVSEIRLLQDLLTEEKLQHQKEVSEMVIRAQEKERTRIGHELHDNVNQILSTTRMFVDMLTPANEEEKKIKERSLEYLLASIEEIRKLSKELVVPHFKEKGLVDSIQSLIEDIQLGSPLRIRFIHDHENDLLSPGKKIAIFRIVQEQFKNILKYSKAKQVDICLHCKHENVQLVIKDDGIGFDPRQSQKGIGISNIHDRTRYYKGSVNIDSAPGKGCVLTVNMPLLS